jgi:hypothetical protein
MTIPDSMAFVTGAELDRRREFRFLQRVEGGDTE